MSVTGKPTASGLPEWKPFDGEQRATMVFDTRTELQYDVDPEIRALWTA